MSGPESGSVFCLNQPVFYSCSSFSADGWPKGFCFDVACIPLSPRHFVTHFQLKEVIARNSRVSHLANALAQTGFQIETFELIYHLCSQSGL